LGQERRFSRTDAAPSGRYDTLSPDRDRRQYAGLVSAIPRALGFRSIELSVAI
jgi:hypothetical protein